MFNMKRWIISIKTMWFSTSSLMLVTKSREIRITTHGGLFGSGGLFVKITFNGGGLFGTRGLIDHLWHVWTGPSTLALPVARCCQRETGLEQIVLIASNSVISIIEEH